MKKIEKVSKKNASVELITAEEAAKILRVDRSQITRFAQQGSLKAFKIGRRLHIDRASVYAFIEQSEIRN